MILKKYFQIFFIIFVGALFVFVAKSRSASQDVSVLNFSAANDFTISDSSKVKFSNGSAKIIPSGLEESWGEFWYDTHFAPGVAESGAYGIAIDDNDYIYTGGSTKNSAGGSNKAFVVKTNQSILPKKPPALAGVCV